MSFGETDAIITLGGGLDKQGALDPRNYHRLDTAIKLFHAGAAENFIVTGGWSFTRKKKPDQTEARQMKQYATEAGVPEDAIFVEETSHDTIGNVVFAKKQILIPNQWRDVTVVTSESHLARGVNISDHVLGDGYTIHGVPAPEKRGLKEKPWELAGKLMLAHVIDGTERGDEDAIEQRLIDLVPGYGGQRATVPRLAAKSAVGALRHPGRFRS